MGQSLICAKVVVEGFHFWKDAPEEVAFLRDNHRHLFYIYARKFVTHDDRDTEFILYSRKIKKAMVEKWGDANGSCQFGSMSCEMIARWISDTLGADAVAVFEDDENGGEYIKESGDFMPPRTRMAIKGAMN